MSDVRADVQYAWRQIRRRPWLYLAIFSTLAIGIGANTAVFVVTRGVLLRPLPYPEPTSLVMIWRTPGDRPAFARAFFDEAHLTRQIATAAMVREWRTRSTLLRDFAAIELWQGNPSSEMDIVAGDRIERLRGALATPNLFTTLGVGAALGRTFVPSDDDQVAILSDGLWRRMFGADPGIIGKRLDIAFGRQRRQRSMTIVGVLPAAFRFTYPMETEIWSAVSWSEIESPATRGLRYQVLARVSPGATLPAAQAEMDTIYASQEEALGIPLHLRMSTRLELIHDYVVGRVRTAIAMLAAVAVLVLLICCMSVAALFVASTVSRRREFALRLALGATHGRIARQLAIESTLVALMAALTAVLAIVAIQPVIRSLLPSSIPRFDEIGIDVPTISITTLFVVFAILYTSFAPAWAAAANRTVDFGGTPAATSGSRRRTFRQMLIVLELGLVSVLLVGGGRLLQSFWNLSRVDLGFEASDVVTAEMRLLSPRYRDDQHRRSFQDELLTRVRSLPGVLSASLTSSIPLRGVDMLRSLDHPDGRGTLLSNERQVGHSYFDVMRIPLVSGRVFSETDQPSSKSVLILSESLARTLFPDGDALGRTLIVRQPTEVIGIVGDVRARRVDTAAAPAYYVPWIQVPTTLICLVIRSSAPTAPIETALPLIVHSIDPDQPIQRVATLDDVVSQSIAEPRFYGIVTTTFGVVTLLLAAVGIFGVLGIAVTERIREFGIRAAIGASPRDQIVMLMRQGMTPILLGVLAGNVAAFWVMQLIRRFLFELDGLDVVANVATGTLTVLVAGIACYVPARRAAHTDALAALRRE